MELTETFPTEVRFVLEILREVYITDARARDQGLGPAQRLQLHQDESQPRMAALEHRMHTQFAERKIEPNSALGAAILYMQKQRSELTLFLRVQGAPLDNNTSERALKKAILHRKNSLFYRTLAGAHVGDVFMSLIHTAELNHIAPFEYLVALQRNATPPPSLPPAPSTGCPGPTNSPSRNAKPVRILPRRPIRTSPNRIMHHCRKGTKQRGRPGPDTEYRRVTRRRYHLEWTIDQAAIEYDKKSDGMYSLICNDHNLTAVQLLEAHKGQPTIEKRFEQIKSVHEIAPVFLKNLGRIEALFTLYFLALLVQALIERDLRLAMKREKIKELPIYSNRRSASAPPTEQILRLFSLPERHTLLRDEKTVQSFPPQLTDIQLQTPDLLGAPVKAFLG